MKDVPVDLLDEAFAARLALIAADARTSIEAMARREAERQRERAIAAMAEQLAALDRRLSEMKADAEHERLATERAELTARLERVQKGSLDHATLVAGRPSEEALAELIFKVKATLAERIAAARRETRVAETRSDEAGAYLFAEIRPGTYHVYCLLRAADGSTVHYLQRVRLEKDGRHIPDAPVAMSPEALLHGILQAAI